MTNQSRFNQFLIECKNRASVHFELILLIILFENDFIDSKINVLVWSFFVWNSITHKLFLFFDAKATKNQQARMFIRLGRIYIPTINFFKFFVIWEVGGKVGGPRPLLVSKLISNSRTLCTKFRCRTCFCLRNISRKVWNEAKTVTLCF